MFYFAWILSEGFSPAIKRRKARQIGTDESKSGRTSPNPEDPLFAPPPSVQCLLKFAGERLKADSPLPLIVLPLFSKREGVPEMGTKPLKALRGYRASNRGSNRGSRGSNRGSKGSRKNTRGSMRLGALFWCPFPF